MRAITTPPSTAEFSAIWRVGASMTRWELLLQVTDPEQREQIEHLIAEEEAKDLPPN
jgi:hypothetical protein